MGCSSLGPSPTLGSSFPSFLNKSTFILPPLLRSYNPFQWNFIYFYSPRMKPRASNVQGKSFTVESPPSDPMELFFFFLNLIVFIISVCLQVNLWRSENNFSSFTWILGDWIEVITSLLSKCLHLLSSHWSSSESLWSFSFPFLRLCCAFLEAVMLFGFLRLHPKMVCTRTRAAMDLLIRQELLLYWCPWLWTVNTLVWMD